jgi:ribosome recycling factor
MTIPKVTILEGNSTAFEAAIKTSMDQAIDHFKKELATIRSGRAHTSMVEDLKVLCYNGQSELKLREIAAIAAPDVNMIVIEPWDKSIIHDIERAITKSELGITPVADGTIIRLTLPVMSTQRREELIKMLHKKLEDSRVNIRAIRRDFHNLLREHEKKLSEDFSKRIMDKLQKITDQHISLVEDIAKKKETEVKGS